MNLCNEILQQVKKLPPLPDTVLKLMEVVNNPLAGMDDLVEAIKYDQAVVSELLRMCNSAYFGMSRRIVSLDEAMLRLGTIKVLQLVMAIHTTSLLTKPQAGYGLSEGMLWKHSVGTALGSSIIAQKLHLANGSLVFTAGLLHDIGKLILNDYVAKEFAEIIDRVNEQGQSFVEAEQEVLGCSHQDVGAQVAEIWQLPEPIVRCIQYHHDPSMVDPPDPLVDVVYLADSICLLLGIGLGEDGLSYRADEAVMTRLKLHEHDLEAIGAQMLIELKQVEQNFVQPGASRRQDANHHNVGAE